MALVTMKPGSQFDAVTLEEITELFTRSPSETGRMRIPKAIGTDASGNIALGAGDIYTVPAGCKFQVRRVVFTFTGNAPSDPNAGNVALTAGHWIAYLRSNSLIEYAQPGYGAAVQVPGVQTWGSEQGPELSPKEIFGVTAVGLTAATQLTVYVEGILSGPRST